MPDSQSLTIAVITPTGDQAESVEITPGPYKPDDRRQPQEGIKALSPDGRQIAYSEKILGRPYRGASIANLDGTGRKLIAALDSAMAIK